MSKEIARFEAGQELDALIAEYVMEWRWYSLEARRTQLFPPESYNARWFREFPWIEGKLDVPLVDMAPHYSTDIREAWKVAEKLGLALIPQSAAAGFDWLALDLDSVRHGGDIVLTEKDGTAFGANTAPLAICRAALAVVENYKSVDGDFCGNCRRAWPCDCDDPVHCCGICAGYIFAGECRCSERYL